MEERFIQEMNADEIIRFPEFHVHATIQKRNAFGKWELDNVIFDDFDTKEDALLFARQTILKYGSCCRDCEITQAVDTLVGKEDKRIFFSEPWRRKSA